jgi:hypothetical protein
MTNLYIEKTFNGDYFVNMFMALFYYSQSNFNKLLHSNLKDFSGYYLQDLIEKHFVEKIKKGYIIERYRINEIRNFMCLLGLGNDKNLKHMDFIDLDEFYSFLQESMDGDKIMLDIIDIHKNSESSFIKNLIKVPVYDNDFSNNIVSKWLNDNFSDKIFCLKNIPRYIAIFFDKKKDVEIDINNYFYFHNINDKEQKKIYWTIQSIICFDGEKYITFLKYYHWMIFDYNQNYFQQLKKIDNINDYKKYIKKNVVFTIYNLNLLV